MHKVIVGYIVFFTSRGLYVLYATIHVYLWTVVVYVACCYSGIQGCLVLAGEVQVFNMIVSR